MLPQEKVKLGPAAERKRVVAAAVCPAKLSRAGMDEASDAETFGNTESGVIIGHNKSPAAR